MTPKLKIFFAFNILIGKAKENCIVIFPYIQKQKSYTCGPKVSNFASMIVLNFTRLSKLKNEVV